LGSDAIEQEADPGGIGEARGVENIPPIRMKTSYRTIVVRHVDETFAAAWRALWEHAATANIFNSYEWFLACTTEAGAPPSAVYACYDGAELVALLPIVFVRCYGIRTASSLAGKYSIDTPFLVARYDDELFAHFFSAILAVENLHLVRMDARSTEFLHRLFPGALFPLMSVNPYLTLQDAPLRYVSKSNQRAMRRVMKKIAWPIRLVVYSSGDDLDGLLEEMFLIDQRSGKAQRARDIFSDERTRDFYRNIVKNCRQFIQIALLYFGDTPVAYSFGFVNRGVLFGYQTSHLSQYRKWYPGKILLMRLLEASSGALIGRIEFGGGISSYKQEFTPEYYFQYDLYHSRNPLVRAWWRLINLARRAKQVILPEKHTRDGEFLFKTFPQQHELERQIHAA
jgi:CelD/BcsL family acetyltransferase involved in cellulose biosynthesis